MFEEIKDTFVGPEIPAAIIQKFAVNLPASSSRKQTTIQTKTYKAMLKRVKEKLNMLNDKQLVDTFYSIGRLH